MEKEKVQHLFQHIDQQNDDQRNRIAQVSLLKQQLKEKRDELERIGPQIELLEQVRVFLQQLAEAARDEVMSGLEKVVTLCLQTVFGPHLSFEIEVETSRNNTVVEFYVLDDSGDHIIRLKPEDSMGGGVVDTIAIGLRFGLKKVVHPMPEGPLFLDEPAKMVSADKIDRIADLLKVLSEMFGTQIIMVTHHEPLMDVVDHAVYVKNENGISICQ